MSIFDCQFLFKLPGLTDVHRRRWTLSPTDVAELVNAKGTWPVADPEPSAVAIGYVRFNRERSVFTAYLRNRAGEVIRLFEFIHPGDAVKTVRRAYTARWLD